ncbi:hypothetical protein AVEN_235829-1 [Araneus ventricosus]|uniref:Uncharacterized protein n=1 Tax=Araneus ventricosus TaxID=182803 RepID=A0A4Y2PLF3_ARAVE|nr:hypothetical protein AVEN_235829-1 [Araneus ventricosus]
MPNECALTVPFPAYLKRIHVSVSDQCGCLVELALHFTMPNECALTVPFPAYLKRIHLSVSDQCSCMVELELHLTIPRRVPSQCLGI